MRVGEVAMCEACGEHEATRCNGELCNDCYTTVSALEKVAAAVEAARDNGIDLKTITEHATEVYNEKGGTQ